MAEQKPIFKAPEKKPFQMAAPEPSQPPQPSPPEPTKPEAGWQPIATAPSKLPSGDDPGDRDVEFLVRATVLGRDGKRTPIANTETLVKYRMSRKMSGGRWTPAFAMIDAKLETKLGFRPTEWKPAPPPPKADA